MKHQKGDAASFLLIGLIVLILASFISYRSGASVERVSQEDKAKKIAMQYLKEEVAARALHDKVMKQVVETQNKTNLDNAYAHEIALEKVNADLAAARAESRRLGGLLITIPAPACKGDYVGAATETTGAGQRDEKATITVALPEPVETGLWSIVGQADEVTEQLRSCQGWIKANGFYGEK